MARKIDECPKCGEYKKLTRHHIFPKRNFKGTSQWNRLASYNLWICRKCHDDLEMEIPYERKPLHFYPRFTFRFLETSARFWAIVLLVFFHPEYSSHDRRHFKHHPS